MGQHSPIPVTYAGGARSVEDLERVRVLGKDKVDLTIGSALDVSPSFFLLSSLSSFLFSSFPFCFPFPLFSFPFYVGILIFVLLNDRYLVGVLNTPKLWRGIGNITNSINMVAILYFYIFILILKL